MPEDNFAQTCAAIILVVAMVRYATLTKLRSQGTDNRLDIKFWERGVGCGGI